MKAYNIKWDLDDDDINVAPELPREIEIPSHMTDDEEISDYITAVAEFCHKGFSLKDSD